MEIFDDWVLSASSINRLIHQLDFDLLAQNTSWMPYFARLLTKPLYRNQSNHLLMLAGAKAVTLSQGSLIFNTGTIEMTVCILLQGTVHLYKPKDGDFLQKILLARQNTQDPPYWEEEDEDDQ